MESIAAFFTKNYKFTLVVTFGVIMFGYFGVLSLNSESYPAVDFATASIETPYDGATAEDIETRITKPIEDEIRSVSGIKDVRSVSQAGMSKIIVRVDLENSDVSSVMSDLQRAVDRVSDLPADLRDRPKFVELKSEEFPVVEVAVVGSNEGRRRDLVVDLLKEDIEDNKAVLSARPAGFRERMFKIVLDTEKMQRFHIGIDEVLGKIEARNVNIPGGELESPGQQKLVRVEGKIANSKEIEDVIVRANFSGRAIRLKDIAEVLDSEEDANVIALYNGEPATLLVVTKKSGSDTLALVKDIDEKIERFQSNYGDQFDFVIYENEAKRVANKLSILTSNAVSGLFLVVFFLLLFLPFRIGLVASFSLPIGVLATLGFVPILGMNLNAITILALVIALGMLVDNSVVISENFTRLLDEGRSVVDAARESIAQLWKPITATVMTTIAAFLPMLVTKGIMGEFIKYIPIIVTISLLVSLAESFFLLPMRLEGTASLVRKNQVDRSDGDKAKPAMSGASWFDHVASRFERFMLRAIRFRYLTLLAFLVCIVGSVVMMTVFNKMVLFPADQTEKYIARLEMPRGSTLDETQDAMRRLTVSVLEKTKDNVLNVVARSGTSQMGPIDPRARSGDNIGMLVISVNEYTKNNVSDTQFLATLRSIKMPEVAKEVTYEGLMNGPPVGEPVNATFRSNNTESLATVIDTIVKDLSQTKGLIDVAVDDIYGDQMVYVDIDYPKADRLGLDVRGIGNAVRAAVSGRMISSVNLNNKEVDLQVRFKADNRQGLADLDRIEILDRRGYLIPLSSVAKFRVEEPSPQIKRFDFKRSRTVTANVEEGVITAIEANKVVANKYADLKSSYPDVSLVFGGEGESTKESMDSLWSALRLSLIGIFALLVLLFNSFAQPMIIMTTIPLGLVGFSIAFAAHGRPISFLALIGVIGLGGIIVNSGIILISFIDQLRSSEKSSLHIILAKASRLRLRAVVVSSLTTISGLLPTAYGIGGSDALLMPMTLAMAWGLTSGTLLTLVWVPCAYAILEDISRGFKNLLGRRGSQDSSSSPSAPPSSIDTSVRAG